MPRTPLSLLPIIAALGLTALSAALAVRAEPSPPWYPPSTGQGDVVMGVYQSRFPCLDEGARTRPQCERLKFALALYHEPKSGRPTRYMMARVYVGHDDTRIIDSGRWSFATGTKTDPEARVVRLDETAPADFRHFWAITEDVIFVLDGEGKPRVGDAGYGYAVNRTD